MKRTKAQSPRPEPFSSQLTRAAMRRLKAYAKQRGIPIWQALNELILTTRDRSDD